MRSRHGDVRNMSHGTDEISRLRPTSQPVRAEKTHTSLCGGLIRDDQLPKIPLSPGAGAEGMVPSSWYSLVPLL